MNKRKIKCTQCKNASHTVGTRLTSKGVIAILCEKCASRVEARPISV